MNTWPDHLILQGCPERRGGDRPLRLDDPDQAWLIRAGQVELFLVSLDPDGSEGARHHLATLATGGLLLGIAADDLTGFALLGVPHVDTDLLQLPFALLQAESRAAAVIPALAPALDLWLHALSHGMARWATPRPYIDFGIGAQETLTIPAQRRCSSRHAPAWVRLPPQAGIFLDSQDLPPADGELTLPLAPEAWLLTTCVLELQSRTTAAALADGDAWAGVLSLHQILFDTAGLNLRLANVDEHLRLQARQAATEAERDHAFRDLLTITAPRSRFAAAAARGDSPLVAVLRLLGRHEGFSVQLPANLKPGIEPTLEEIARASGLRPRLVTLSSDWQQHDFGNLLAFDRVTRQPLALLCDTHGQVRLIDPLQGEEQPFATARQRLAPDAWEFTAPLPLRPIRFRELLAFAFGRGWRDLLPMLLAAAVLGLLGIVKIGRAHV
jgi:hypothetical protein